MLDKLSYLQQLEKCFDEFAVHESVIRQALDFAIKAHQGQVRKYDKTPFVTHPMAVSLDLACKYQDSDLVIAGLLHDTVEDCPDVGVAGIYERFGHDIGFLVEAVTDHPLYFIDDTETIYNDKIEKILAGGMKDVRVLLLKIADRDHNLDTLAGLKPHKQIRMTFETQAIYEPLHTIVNNDNNDIATASQKFTDYIEKFDLNDPSTLKHNLYNQTFHNFDHDTYLLAYNNTKAIIRQSEDKEWFEKLLSSSKFDDHGKIISLWTDGEDFLARFVFTKGAVFGENPRNKFKIFNFLSNH